MVQTGSDSDIEPIIGGSWLEPAVFFLTVLGGIIIDSPSLIPPTTVAAGYIRSASTPPRTKPKAIDEVRLVCKR